MIGENELLDYEETKASASSSDLQVEVGPGTKLSDIATLLSMKEVTLLKMNKQYKNGMIPKERVRYKIMIPEEKMMLFYMKYEIPVEKKKVVKPYFISHYVVMGNTLESLAKQYQTDPEEIKEANKLDDDALTLNMLLLIPVSEALFEKMLSE